MCCAIYNIVQLNSRTSCPNLNLLLVPKNDKTRELPVHGAGSDGDLPGRNIGYRTGCRSRISGRANHNNPMLHGVEWANGYTIVKQRIWISSKRHRQHVDAVVDRQIKRRQYIGIEALISGRWRPADLVSGHASPRWSALGGAIPQAENASSGDEVTARRGQGMRTMPFFVPRRIERRIERSDDGFIAFVEVSCSD